MNFLLCCSFFKQDHTAGVLALCHRHMLCVCKSLSKIVFARSSSQSDFFPSQREKSQRIGKRCWTQFWLSTKKPQSYLVPIEILFGALSRSPAPPWSQNNDDENDLPVDRSSRLSVPENKIDAVIFGFGFNVTWQISSTTLDGDDSNFGGCCYGRRCRSTLIRFGT